MGLIFNEISEVLSKIGVFPEILYSENADRFRNKFLGKFAPNLPTNKNIFYWEYFDNVNNLQCDFGLLAAIKASESMNEIYFFLEKYQMQEILVFANSQDLSKFLRNLDGIWCAYLCNKEQTFFFGFSDEDYIYSNILQKDELIEICNFADAEFERLKGL
jgi:hypothetical protein